MGNHSIKIEFSRAEYLSKLNNIQAVVAKYKDDERFVLLLEKLYEVLVNRNVN
jgi:hypothetical protein